MRSKNYKTILFVEIQTLYEPGLLVPGSLCFRDLSLFESLLFHLERESNRSQSRVELP